MHIFILALDRLVAISSPLRYKESIFCKIRNTRIIIIVLWIVCGVWACLPFLFDIITCNWYVYSILYGFYSVPILGVIAINCIVTFSLWSQNHVLNPRSLSSYKNITCSTFLISVSLVVCYGPKIVWWQIDLLGGWTLAYPQVSAVLCVAQVRITDCLACKYSHPRLLTVLSTHSFMLYYLKSLECHFRQL